LVDRVGQACPVNLVHVHGVPDPLQQRDREPATEVLAEFLQAVE
jgi:hypothetical protein